MNPPLVNCIRGNRIENIHRGSVCICDENGSIDLAIGDVQRHIFPRSAVKALQALPLVEAGGADAFSDKEFALICSSHGGEQQHIDLACQMLQRTGCGCDILACGPHWPMHEPAARTLARQGKSPNPLHNACSGKHIGFICLAHALGTHTDSYHQQTHLVQREVKRTLEELCEFTLRDETAAIDGCSIPTWPIPMHALALAFARFGTGYRLQRRRAEAAGRLRKACSNEPWYVGGTGRVCTELLRLFGDRIFVKFGADGVYTAALPELGLGVAIKCDDGSVRAAEIILATIISHFLPCLNETFLALQAFTRHELRSWRGEAVGQLEPSTILLTATK